MSWVSRKSRGLRSACERALKESKGACYKNTSTGSDSLLALNSSWKYKAWGKRKHWMWTEVMKKLEGMKGDGSGFISSIVPNYSGYVALWLCSKKPKPYKKSFRCFHNHSSHNLLRKKIVLLNVVFPWSWPIGAMPAQQGTAEGSSCHCCALIPAAEADAFPFWYIKIHRGKVVINASSIFLACS